MPGNPYAMETGWFAQPNGDYIYANWTSVGRLLAVAFSDSSLCLVNAHTGKIVHRFQNPTSTESNLCCLGWGVSFTDSASITKHLAGKKEEATLEDMLSQGLRDVFSDLPRDLPADLANLDIEAVLPKLSTLPLGSKE